MADIANAVGTESPLENQKLEGNGTVDSHSEKASVLKNGDVLNGDEDDEGEESDEYDVEEEEQIVGDDDDDDDDEYEIDEEAGGYEPEDNQNGTGSLTALLMGDPNSTVGNDDDDEDDEGDYEEDEEDEEPEPVSPSTSKKRSIDDLEEADSSEAKKPRA